MPRPNQKEALVLLLVLLFGFIVRVYGISRPDKPYFDEKYYVSAAHDYIEGRPDDNSVHPPLAKLQIAAGMILLDGLKAYGLNPLPDSCSWRFASLVTGCGVMLLTYYLALVLTGNVRLSLIALFLIATDFLQVVQSRITMLDQIQDFWILAGLLACAIIIFQRDCSRTGQLWLAGICFGVATGCKWNGLFAAVAGVMALTFVPQADERSRLRRFFSASAVFAVAIALVYSLAYTPLLVREWYHPDAIDTHEETGAAPAAASLIPPAFAATPTARASAKATDDDEDTETEVPLGAPPKAPPPPRAHDLRKFLRAGLDVIVGYHKRMWQFRYDPKQFHHRYLSQFYQWPLVMRPIWYFYEENDRAHTMQGIVALGSPVFWWASAILLIELLLMAVRRQEDRVGRYLLLTYLSLWLLWAASTTGGFFYYMLPATPLMAVLVAREIERWWQERSSVRLAIGYLVLIQISFTLYYPFLTGIPIPSALLHRMFFGRWI